jgi:membrane protein YdbS with pleckstrin-like domain
MPYWVKLKSSIKGPFTKVQLKALVDSGRISAGTPISKSEDGPWRELSLAGATPQPVVTPAPNDLAKYEEEGYSEEEESYSSEEEGYSDEEDYQEPVPYPEVSVDAESFTQRTRELGSEVSHSLSISAEIPREMREMFGADEELLYGSRPAQIVLMAQLAITGILAAVTALPVIYFQDLFTGVLMLVGYAFVAYCNYLGWKNTVFAITSRHVHARRGIFRRSIGIVPIKNVQMVGINTGMIDRWLGLNKVVFMTGATLPVPYIGLIGAVCFRHVDSTRVMKAFGGG